MNILAFRNHFDSLLRTYNRVYVLNLLSQSKMEEQKLSTTLIDQLDQRNDQNISYYCYDFHRELAGDNFDQISGLMNIISRPMLSDKYHMFIHRPESD